MEEFEALRDDPAWLVAEERRLRRLAPLEVSMRIGGVYEVARRSPRLVVRLVEPLAPRGRRAGAGIDRDEVGGERLEAAAVV